MSRILGKHTKPELLIRKGLHARGLRYRLHVKGVPGTPDIVFPKLKIAVFINGCFWHFHQCKFSKLPATRPDFWKGKLEGNRERDRRNSSALLAQGWRIINIWECSLRSKSANEVLQLLDEVTFEIRQGTKSVRNFPDT